MLFIHTFDSLLLNVSQYPTDVVPHQDDIVFLLRPHQVIPD